jgi:transposase
MPPTYVKRQKNDTTDAEGICEAVGRPNMRSCRPRDLSNRHASRESPAGSYRELLHGLEHLFVFPSCNPALDLY